MKRIAIAGFQHETNTFGATFADMSAFEMADSWPPLLRGQEVITGTDGNALPIAGFIRAASDLSDWELLPALWCSAEPSSYVTDDAFERITSEIIARFTQMQPIDAIYLDLHGAMVTQSHPDGEGVFLAKLREVFGPDIPIVASLDLHANVTNAMVTHATALTMFRTYPHLDMAQTGARAAQVLHEILDGKRYAKAFAQAGYLIPLHAQYTGDGAGRQLYDLVHQLAGSEQWAELAMGFPSADIYDAGPSVFAYAPTQATADQMVASLAQALDQAQAVFDTTLLTPTEAAQRAVAQAGPILLADVQDNAGGGASSDTTGLAHALIAAGARGALIGMLHDPFCAARAHEVGVGGVFDATLGGRIPDLDPPLEGQFQVLALSDGTFAFSGEMYAGCIAQTGPSAALRYVDIQSQVDIVVSSVRCQALDQAVFTHLGLSFDDYPILSLKSTVHYRADFDPLYPTILNVAARGLMSCQLDAIPYKHLRPALLPSPARAPLID